MMRAPCPAGSLDRSRHSLDRAERRAGTLRRPAREILHFLHPHQAAGRRSPCAPWLRAGACDSRRRSAHGAASTATALTRCAPLCPCAWVRRVWWGRAGSAAHSGRTFHAARAGAQRLLCLHLTRLKQSPATVLRGQPTRSAAAVGALRCAPRRTSLLFSASCCGSMWLAGERRDPQQGDVAATATCTIYHRGHLERDRPRHLGLRSCRRWSA